MLYFCHSSLLLLGDTLMLWPIWGAVIALILILGGKQ